MPRSSIVLATLIVLSGCAMGASSDPPDYRAGYAAGCRSGHADASGETQAAPYDAETFGADRVYREGWSRGYLECLIQARQASPGSLFGFPFFPAH